MSNFYACTLIPGTLNWRCVLLLLLLLYFRRLNTAQHRKNELYQSSMSVTIHTSIGDIKLEIFCDTAPRTAFNFLALAGNGSYDGTLFHRTLCFSVLLIHFDFVTIVSVHTQHILSLLCHFLIREHPGVYDSRWRHCREDWCKRWRVYLGPCLVP